jgi:hypothetical protein
MSCRRQKLGLFLGGMQALLLGGLVGCGGAAPVSQPAAPILGSAGVTGAGAAGSIGLPPVTPVQNLPIASAGRSAVGVGTAGSGGTPPMAAAGSSAAGGTAGTAAAHATGPIPCGVTQALGTHCTKCHGATPIGGAPMPLITLDDFQQPAKSMPSLKVYQLVKMRINDKAKPMPPGGGMPAADLTTLDTWLGAGALAGTDADKQCATSMTPTPVQGGTGDGAYGAITPLPGETCYDFPVHGGQTMGDSTAYDVGNGEHYEQFYFKAPWPAGTVATRYGTKFDNQKVIHHWLLFGSDELDAEGTHKSSPLPTLLGVNATLIAGWAVGGTNLAMPEDVGFELPETGATINLQWHFYNNTTSKQLDKSVVQICTVPAGKRPHTATVTWVGTEDLGGNKWFGGAGMPPHQMSTFSGTCDPLREGMNSTEPIHIVGFWPHMHQLGTNMKAVVNHQNGTQETIFEKAFDFNYQIHYLQKYDLMPGDTLTASCTFNNTTNQGVPFGESSDTEMCYNFTFAWPAHALENHVVSLIGATNTCW